MTLYATLLIFAVINSPSYINYTSPSEDYTMEISNTIKPVRFDQKNGYLDVFQFVDTLDGKTGPGYIMTILKTTPHSDFHYSSLTTKEFQKGYENGCKCAVTSYDEVQYKQEKGVSYTIKYKHGKVPMAGYTVTLVKGSNIYIVNFSTTEAAMDQYFPDYFHAMNTFDMHPSQMIVGASYKSRSLSDR